VTSASDRPEPPNYQGQVPTSHHPSKPAESIGDPDADDPEAGGHEGAAAGAVLGTAVAGPFGMAAGALVGGIAGTAGEAVDDPDDPRDQPLDGTASFDPTRPGQEDEDDD
jgi:hypothetical protein